MSNLRKVRKSEKKLKTKLAKAALKEQKKEVQLMTMYSLARL